MAEFCVDYFKYGIDIFQNLTDLGSWNSHAVLGQAGRSIAVGCNLVCLAMTASVDFYREPSFKAEKIEHKTFEGHLSFEFPTVDLRIAKFLPHGFLSVHFRSTQ